MASSQRLLWVSLLPLSPGEDGTGGVALACAITEANLEPVAETSTLLVHDLALRPTLAAKLPHVPSRSPLHPAASVDEKLSAFVDAHPIETKPPLCARYAWLVREAIAAKLPSFAGRFHYRNVDLITIDTLVEMWQPAATRLSQPPPADPAAMLQQDIAWLRAHRTSSFAIAAEGSKSDA